MHDVFKNLLVATIANDRAQFVADCTDKMTEAITPEKLASASELIEPRARGGYDTDYFGELKKVCTRSITGDCGSKMARTIFLLP